MKKSLKNTIVYTLGYLVSALCLLTILSIGERAVFAQGQENGKTESVATSLLIPVVDQSVQNNSGLKANRTGIQVDDSSVFTRSICSNAIFNSADIYLYLLGARHNKYKKDVDHSYLAEEVDVLSENEGKRRLKTTFANCQHHQYVAGAQLFYMPAKLNSPLLLPVTPNHKPKQALRWHMII